MARRVATVNIPKLVLLGLVEATVASGYDIEPTADPISWANAHPGEAVLVGIRDDEQLRLLGELATISPPLAIVALLDPFSEERLRSCLGAGACGCVSSDWSAKRVVLGIEAALNGLALLPAPMARDLAVHEMKRSSPSKLSSSQQAWLKSLASGMTVNELARQVGFSERETYRRLKQIYSALGVRGRTEALMLASASGLLDGAAVG